jgi:hypothetical protein
MPASASLARCLAAFGTDYRDRHPLSLPQAKVWRAIENCRTAALGGHRLQCGDCGHSEYVYHSCRNRHCPQCQTRTKDAWTRARLAEVLPVPYGHLVFTLPHDLNALAAVHDRWLYETLLACVAHTLTEFALNPRWLGAVPAFSLVLHTWTQDLRRHVHVHAVMACGGLDNEGRWITPQRQPRFLFPVHALSRVFRAKFLHALDAARRTRLIPCDPAAGPAAWNKRRRALLKHDWVVYAKTPLGGAAEVLAYLSRYTHRTAISNERIVAIRERDVLLWVRADERGGKRVIRLPGTTFIGRFLQHVLPPGFKRIRHYGLLAPARKAQRLSAARQALNAPAPNPLAQESAEQFMQRVAQRDIVRCPCCGKGRLQTVEVLLPQGRTEPRRIPGVTVRCNNRGPP